MRPSSYVVVFPGLYCYYEVFTVLDTETILACQGVEYGSKVLSCHIGDTPNSWHYGSSYSNSCHVTLRLRDQPLYHRKSPRDMDETSAMFQPSFWEIHSFLHYESWNQLIYMLLSFSKRFSWSCSVATSRGIVKFCRIEWFFSLLTICSILYMLIYKDIPWEFVVKVW